MDKQNHSKFQPWTSEESFRFLVENIPDYAIFMIDPFGRVASWNKGAERQFGYEQNEIIGKEFAQLFTPEDRKKGAPEQEMETARKSGQAPDQRYHLRKDNTRFYVDGVLAPMRDDFGQVTGFIKLVHSIGEKV